MVRQDDGAVVGIEPLRRPPFDHEVRHLQSHPCRHEIPERFTDLAERRQHPLENFVVSYVAIQVLHPLHLIVAHIDTKEFVQSSVRYRIDVSARICRA